MSLKAFHLIFITAASALAAGFGVWSVRNYASPDGSGSDLAYGVVSFVVSVGLLAYEVYFLKKTKNVSYL